jgi:hypothetical protein
VPGHAEGPRAANLGQSGAFVHSNSSDGSAILSMSDMRPGDSIQGVVTIANEGDEAGALALSGSIDSDQPGPGGGRLPPALALTVDDVTAGRVVYSGSLDGLNTRQLGDFSPSEAHSYRFTVSLPASADSAVAGAAASVRYSWTDGATGGSSTGGTTPPPTGTTQPPTGTGTTPPPTGTGTTTPPPPPGDRRAPRLVLTAPAKQRMKSTYVTARCDEPCVLVAMATVTGVKGVRTIRMVVPAKAVPAGKQVRLVAKPAGKAAKLIAKALKRKKKVSVLVKVQARDLARNSATGSRALSLRR